MGFEKELLPDVAQDNNNNNKTHEIVAPEHAEIQVQEKKTIPIFQRLAKAALDEEKQLKLGLEQSKQHHMQVLNDILRKRLILKSLNIDTVFGYDFEYRENTEDDKNDEASQVLHPYITSGSTAFGGSLALLLHGKIKLPRTEIEAKAEDAQWLIFGASKNLYCISLAELRKKDNILGLTEDASIDQITVKIHELNIKRYGWASQNKKDQLIPHTYVTYADAFLASLFSLPFYLLPAPYNLFGFMFTMGIFFYRLHPQLEAIQYQRHKNGRRPSMADTEIIWHDAVIVGLQTGLAATLTTFMMNVELHQAIGFNMSEAIRCVLPNIMPWSAILTLSLMIGIALGVALVGLAQSMHNKDNPYTKRQLSHIFVAGFLAGALIYPLLLLSHTTTHPLICTLLFEYVISVSLGAALHVNARNRLHVAPTKPVIHSKIYNPAIDKAQVLQQKPTASEISDLIIKSNTPAFL